MNSCFICTLTVNVKTYRRRRIASKCMLGNKCFNRIAAHRIDASSSITCQQCRIRLTTLSTEQVIKETQYSNC